MKNTGTLESLVGPCGLHCDICTMYRVSHDQNLGLWEERPRNFRKQLGLGDEVDSKDIACEGCRSSTLFSYCA